MSTTPATAISSSTRRASTRAPAFGPLAFAARLGIAPEETIAVGDNSNDVSMIRAAGLGCAVANATDEAKAAADYVCQADNNAGAVAEVIEKFVLGA